MGGAIARFYEETFTRCQYASAIATVFLGLTSFRNLAFLLDPRFLEKQDIICYETD
ncbi:MULTISPECIES: hypothetical protein [Pleurocapsales]|uniref:hypothetical protein n=1 Tax=Pleurocapsales TaxID=52604 RepID=UPI00029FCAA3|nr:MULTISPECIES: hypothetical protein [Pleurocapsales]AFY79284.1 hypothetical protein Ple7327_4153 [Pleurocapsa sp. PCC 7327]